MRSKRLLAGQQGTLLQSGGAPAPLAARMRPCALGEFVGQEHLVGEGRVLRRAIEQDRVPSMILWGPPGSGKTSLARIIAAMTSSHFSPVSAVTAGVGDLRSIVTEAREEWQGAGRRTILFIDEIHRFNKAQQDVVLPHVEEGTVTLIGATTENPSFEVIGPLLSRCRVFTLGPLQAADMEKLLERALADGQRGIGLLGVDLAPEARRHLVATANGDARVLLDGLELAAAGVEADEGGSRRLGLEAIEEALQRKALHYDKAGDWHYDAASALIKSLRGSDPDAALYWLARMLEAGEDPLFIVRRLVILAAEDVGLADPQALVVAVAAQQAVHFVGMPEGFLPLSEAVIYLATAPKSNSALLAYNRAREAVRRTGNLPVPLHLRNAVTGLMRELGYGKGYRYAHDYAGHTLEQEHLPEALRGNRYYEPTEQGCEATIRERWVRRRDAGGTAPNG